MIHSVNQFEWKKQVVNMYFSYYLALHTILFQKPSCESGQLAFGSWRWYISVVHIVDKQLNYKLHLNTKTSELSRTLSTQEKIIKQIDCIISYHILKSYFLIVTTNYCQHSRSKILCQYAILPGKMTPFVILSIAFTLKMRASAGLECTQLPTGNYRFGGASITKKKASKGSPQSTTQRIFSVKGVWYPPFH